jgi:hypothetical protein
MLLQRGPGKGGTGKRLDWRMAVGFAVAGKMGQSGRGIVRLGTAPQKQGRAGPWMAAEKAREFEAGIAGRAENRSFKFRCHQLFFKSTESLRFLFPASRHIYPLLCINIHL